MADPAKAQPATTPIAQSQLVGDNATKEPVSLAGQAQAAAAKDARKTYPRYRANVRTETIDGKAFKGALHKTKEAAVDEALAWLLEVGIITATEVQTVRQLNPEYLEVE